MNFDAGFYWVSTAIDCEWTIAEFSDDQWWLVGDCEPWRLGDLEIGQKIEQPKDS